MNISFEDTKTAFAYKTNKELKRAEFLFTSMGKEWLVKMGLWPVSYTHLTLPTNREV